MANNSIWEVRTLDVWGNAEDGFDVNQEFPVAKFIFTEKDIQDDSAIVKRLQDEGILVDDMEFEVDGDYGFVSVYIADTYEPVVYMYLKEVR